MPNQQVTIGEAGTSRFWMVYVLGKSGPTKIHKDLGLAVAEADRLATKTLRRVFVMEAIGALLPPENAPEAVSAQSEGV